MTATETLAVIDGLKDLSRAYRGRVLDEAQIDAYLSALEGQSVDWLLDGMRAAKHLYPRFFPSAGELLKACAHAADQASKRRWVTPAMAAAIAQGEHHCGLCEDTGFVYLRDGQAVDFLTAVQDGLRVVARCRCAESNPIRAAKRAREARIGSSRQDG